MKTKIRKVQHKTASPIYPELFKDHVPSQTVCPGCGADMMRVGIDDIARTDDVCDCNKADYSHVVEQLWHKKCLMEYLQNNPEKQTDYRHVNEK